MIVGGLLVIAGLAAVVWGAERFTDGALGTARRLGVSAFWIGAAVSGFEPENLVTGVAAAASALPQIALGTVIGSAVFLLTGALGLSLAIVPMAVTIPRAGAVAMGLALGAFGVALADGRVSRLEGVVLVAAAVALMGWLHRRSRAFTAAENDDDDDAPPRLRRELVLLALGLVALIAGAELVVRGARALVATSPLSETFLGMVVIGLGESVEETARMIVPARRGHPDLALGNVVGTVVVLLALNLGVIALVAPPVADPRVLAFHSPFLAACVVGVAAALGFARRLGRGVGVVLLAAYAAYLAVNVAMLG
ncbi:MAG: sodium:calcium antiporter [Candidatus Rokubacteria bacterium]|nr:sodium:calcium antiporter [Candidatus Rokubacteria bacterium]